MKNYNSVPFSQLKNSDLIVDTVYEGGRTGNLSSEVISKLLHVGNSGGFRKCMQRADGVRTGEEAYVCIYSTGEEIEWKISI